MTIQLNAQGKTLKLICAELRIDEQCLCTPFMTFREDGMMVQHIPRAATRKLTSRRYLTALYTDGEFKKKKKLCKASSIKADLSLYNWQNCFPIVRQIASTTYSTWFSQNDSNKYSRIRRQWWIRNIESETGNQCHRSESKLKHSWSVIATSSIDQLFALWAKNFTLFCLRICVSNNQNHIDGKLIHYRNSNSYRAISCDISINWMWIRFMFLLELPSKANLKKSDRKLVNIEILSSAISIDI